MSPKAGSLRDRWTPDLLQRAVEALCKSKVFTPFPPLTVNGAEYRDLRGLTIREPVHDTSFDHVDFSSARFEYNGQLSNVTAVDCLFTGAELDANISGTYRRCRFDEANLEGAAIMGGTMFSECTFAGADLRAAHGAALVFDCCDFTSANFRGTHFLESEFHHCTWSDARFRHASLGHSKITREGFPAERGIQAPDEILPDVILDFVDWLDSPPLEAWVQGLDSRLEARADQRRQRDQERLVQEARAAFKAKRFDEAIARFSAAAELGPLDELSGKMLTIARKHTG